MTSNNPPYAVLELDQEAYEFLLKNCETNIAFGISLLQDDNVSRASAEKLVYNIENFRKLTTAARAARR